MLKHRDNTYYPPFTVDPTGGGVTTTSGPGLAERATSDQQQPGGGTAVSGVPVAAKKQRVRDIRGIERFKQVVYGEKGLPRFHAMILRNPILMYPPEGIEAARSVVLAERRGEATEKPSGSGTQPLANEGEMPTSLNWNSTVDDSAMSVISEPNGDITLHIEGRGESNEMVENEHPFPPLNGDTNGGGREQKWKSGTEALANYHHKQLDALIALYYEFNHVTFSKLPMKDTLLLLRRCGRSSMPHVLEFEEKLRACRESKLEKLRSEAAEEKRLDDIRLQLQEQRLQMELQRVEEELKPIDVMEDDAVY